MKNLGNMLKQAQQMQTRMQEMQAKLEATEVDGQSGAGMVKLTLTGKGDLRRVSIDPSLLTAEDLLNLVGTGAPVARLAVARRPHIAEIVRDAIAATGD